MSRLVGTGAAAHFEMVNGGQPISTGRRRRDPPRHHVLGQHALRDVARGHRRRRREGLHRPFRQRGQPTFVIDNSDVPLTPSTPGRRPRADLVGVHRHAVQPGRRGLPGRSGRDAVLPVHQRDRTRAGCSPTRTRRTRRSPAAPASDDVGGTVAGATTPRAQLCTPRSSSGRRRRTAEHRPQTLGPERLGGSVQRPADRARRPGPRSTTGRW